MLTIHPGKLGPVKDSSALGDTVQRELLLQLVEAVHFLLCPLVPSQQAQVVVDGLRHEHTSCNHISKKWGAICILGCTIRRDDGSQI